MTCRSSRAILWMSAVLTIVSGIGFRVSVVNADKALDFYAVLGVSKKATKEQISSAYRKLAKQYHPDKNQDANAQQKFQNVARAYEVLSDQSEREKFDKLGPRDYHEQAAAGGGRGDDAGDFWGDIPFSFFGRRRGRDKAPTLKLRLYVTLQQLYRGDLLHVAFNRPVLCIHIEDCLIPRRDCSGEGTKIVQQQVGPGFIVQNQLQDPTCVAQNKGWKKNCTRCPKGATEMDKTFLSAYIEPGALSGEKLEFTGIGYQALGHDAGDLVLEVYELPNTLNLKRHGDHLHTEISITLLEALVGFRKEIKHVNGSMTVVSRSGVTADGEVERLRGEGMPVNGQKEKFGDMFVTLRVHFPVTLDEDQQSALRQILGNITEWKYAVKTTVNK